MRDVDRYWVLELISFKNREQDSNIGNIMFIKVEKLRTKGKKFYPGDIIIMCVIFIWLFVTIETLKNLSLVQDDRDKINEYFWRMSFTYSN